jgi:histidine triad (HIT) family protein
MVTRPDCVFCQIVADLRQCALLTADETSIAFMDIHPANDGHCLVVPRIHVETLFEIDPEIFASVGRMVLRVANAVRNALCPDGLSLVQANGDAAGQTVPHLHVRVLPRRREDRLLLNWPRTREASPDHIAAVAERIRMHLTSMTPAGGAQASAALGPKGEDA